MKKIHFLLVLLCVFQNLFAQNETPFVPVGATWTYLYRYNNGGITPPNSVKILKSICTKDTAVLGKKCSRIDCDYTECSFFSTPLFMYREDKKVFAWKSGEFVLIYDFSKDKAGDSWETAFVTSGNTKSKFYFETQKIDSVTLFNGKKTRQFTLTMGTETKKSLYKNIQIYENIGSNAFILPIILAYPTCDDFNGFVEEIRCYEDKNIGKLQFTSKNCEEKVSDDDLKSGEEITFFPNPAQSELFFDLRTLEFQNGNIRIFNQQGKTVKLKNISQNTDYQSIDVSSFQNGLYFWQIKLENQEIKHGKFLKIK